MSLNKFVVHQKRKRTEADTESENVGEEGQKTKARKLSGRTDASAKTDNGPLRWRKLTAENLELDYVRLFTKGDADDILHELEETLVYNTGRLAQVQLFGKWIDIPRKQVGVTVKVVLNIIMTSL